MNRKKIITTNLVRFILLSFLMVIFFSLQSCQSCSRSGKTKMIAMATEKGKKEARKTPTIPVPNTIIKNIEPEIIEIEDIVTPKEEKIIKKELIKDNISPAEGTLIQVEGLVLKEVNELTIDLKTSPSQIEQILKMRDHVNNNWHYIYDPESGHDTWRSAEATISLKYKGKYSGDCDDFAILMASFARQIGLRSRMVGGFDGKSGHAFAEFLVPNDADKKYLLKGRDYRNDSDGKWISLDWFKGKEHRRFTKNIKVFENI